MLFIRGIIRSVGLCTRFFWFQAIGHKRTLKSLSNSVKDDYKDMGKAIGQDFCNAAVGAVMSFLITLMILYIFVR